MPAAGFQRTPARRLVLALSAALVSWMLGAGVLATSAGADSPPEASPPAPPAAPEAPPYAVGAITLRLTDASRRVRVPAEGLLARTLQTVIRYPASGSPGGGASPDAQAQRPRAPFPLIVFAHGFAVTPSIYARLLDSWARAGYVVAAPLFPLENKRAPGGPDESDLVNEPADVSFVITRMLAENASPASPLAGLVDPSRVAVAGQSDGGEAALAAAYSRRFGDPRVRAAVILSGAEMSGVGGYRFSPGAAPLLAVQGTADTINEPRYTYAYFRAARRPKFLLRLIGAQHLAPYTREGAQLSVVERVSLAFLDAYLEQSMPALSQLAPLGTVLHAAALTADP